MWTDIIECSDIKISCINREKKALEKIPLEKEVPFYKRAQSYLRGIVRVQFVAF